ncbi:bifunctional (p)ppGpp synthetase/guanosine-3',5'-bis(diphosphate) 3'-pyrophosphohydrolase [Candidatus Kaiserbacteria bacterium]|nr:bifunctional (p)ppGpp synthetase/guanosine-3',5'-bis(diphosphate) 3'-pyrophosphohydrolase [Candidatus Kaiserbacteria bacterium]
MNHTPQIKKAIQFAARKHHGQFRKETEPLPCITHLFSVALLVAEDGADDNVVTAALLHDTIEDTPTTREEIVAAFNERVAELVESVSEVKEAGGEILDWKGRKTHYLAHLEDASDDALLIALADKVDNVESWNETFEKEGATFLQHWKRPQEEYLWFYGEALRIAQARLPEHLLTKRYAEAYQIFARSLGSR